MSKNTSSERNPGILSSIIKVPEAIGERAKELIATTRDFFTAKKLAAIGGIAGTLNAVGCDGLSTASLRITGNVEGLEANCQPKTTFGLTLKSPEGESFPGEVEKDGPVEFDVPRAGVEYDIEYGHLVRTPTTPPPFNALTSETDPGCEIQHPAPQRVQAPSSLQENPGPEYKTDFTVILVARNRVVVVVTTPTTTPERPETPVPELPLRWNTILPRIRVGDVLVNTATTPAAREDGITFTSFSIESLTPNTVAIVDPITGSPIPSADYLDFSYAGISTNGAQTKEGKIRLTAEGRDAMGRTRKGHVDTKVTVFE